MKYLFQVSAGDLYLLEKQVKKVKSKPLLLLQHYRTSFARNSYISCFPFYESIKNILSSTHVPANNINDISSWF